MGVKRKVEHHHLSWSLVKAQKVKGIHCESWQCSEMPGLVLTWASRESIANKENPFPFSGFDKHIKHLVEQYEEFEAEASSLKKKRVRLKGKRK